MAYVCVAYVHMAYMCVYKQICHPKTAEYMFYSSTHWHSPVYITCYATKKVSVNLRILKSYKATLITIRRDLKAALEKKNCKNMDDKQYGASVIG